MSGISFFFPVYRSSVLQPLSCAWGFSPMADGKSRILTWKHLIQTLQLLLKAQSLLHSSSSCLPNNTYHCGTLQEEKLGNYVDFSVGKSSYVTSLPGSLNPVQVSSMRKNFNLFFFWEKTSTESAVLRPRHRLLPKWMDKAKALCSVFCQNLI